MKIERDCLLDTSDRFIMGVKHFSKFLFEKNASMIALSTCLVNMKKTVFTVETEKVLQYCLLLQHRKGLIVPSRNTDL